MFVRTVFPQRAVKVDGLLLSKPPSRLESQYQKLTLSTAPRTKSGNVKGENITLDFDAPVVSPETLKDAVCAFVDLLQEVSAEVSGPASKVQWKIEVERGSHIFIARPVADRHTTRAGKAAIRAITSGIRLLERGTDITPPYFNERALKAAKSLATLSDGRKKRVTYLRIKSSGKPLDVTPRALQSVDKLLTGQHDLYGSIEGRLQTVSDRDGYFQFVVFDDLFDKGVNCFISDNKVGEDAIGAFRRRVIVSGIVQYDREGRPTSIKADSIRSFREPKELPTLDELHDIFNKVG